MTVPVEYDSRASIEKVMTEWENESEFMKPESTFKVNVHRSGKYDASILRNECKSARLLRVNANERSKFESKINQWR